jgi:hypothetical protein
MPEAYLTQGETLEIKVSNSWKNIGKIVSSPEIGSTPSKIDATNLASTQMVYVAGIPDYSSELTWTLNADALGTANGNTAVLNSLSSDTVYNIRVTKAKIGAVITFDGFVSWAFGAASVNGLQTIVLKITPTSPFTVAAASRGGPDARGSTGHNDAVRVAVDWPLLRIRRPEGGQVGGVLA